MKESSQHDRTLHAGSNSRGLFSVWGVSLVSVLALSGCVQPAEEAPAKDLPVERSNEDPMIEKLKQLAALPAFGAAPGTTAREWRSIQADTATLFDPQSGAEGKKARARLALAGQAAWPAIINRLVQLDPRIAEDGRMGSLATLTLSDARGSESPAGFDWRSPQSDGSGQMKPHDLYYNCRLITLLHDGWSKVLADPKHWDKFDKSNQDRPSK